MRGSPKRIGCFAERVGGLLRRALAGCLLASLLAPPARPEPPRRTLRNGLEVWISPLPGGDIAAVRLEMDLGLRDEIPGKRGLAAAYLAALLKAPTANAGPGGLELFSSQAGLTMQTDLDHDAIAVTLSGPVSALERALWITGERLAGLRLDEAALDTVRSGIWYGAEGSRYSAVAPQGDPLDTALAVALGPRAGHSPHLSRLWAGRLEDPMLLRSLRRADERARPRVIIAAPESAMSDIEARLDRHLGSAPPRPFVAGGRQPSVRPSERREAPDEEPRVRRKHRRDGHNLVAVVWDLRGVEEHSGLSKDRFDAALFTLVELLEHRGGPLRERLIDGFGVVRAVEVRLSTDETAALGVSAEVRGQEIRNARAQLVKELGRLRDVPVDATLLRAAARSAREVLAFRWSRAVGRAELVGALLRSGRAGPEVTPAAWFEGFGAALRRLRPADLQNVAAWGLQPDRRAVIELESEVHGVPRVKLDEEARNTFRRVMVDVRCPHPSRKASLGELLREKYSMTPEQYVNLTRAVARRPQLMRELTREAIDRCNEYRKLRGMFTLKRGVALHEAVACKAGKIAKEARRQRVLARIFKRFDVDPWVYRPLMGMLMEELDSARQLRQIDARCKPAYGPAARLRR